MKGKRGKSTRPTGSKQEEAKELVKQPSQASKVAEGYMAAPRLDKKARGLASGGPAKWIQKAHLKKGALTAQADRAGETVHEFAESHKNDSGKTGKRARLALTFQKMAKNKKK